MPDVQTSEVEPTLVSFNGGFRNCVSQYVFEKQVTFITLICL